MIYKQLPVDYYSVFWLTSTLGNVDLNRFHYVEDYKKGSEDKYFELTKKNGAYEYKLSKCSIYL